MKANKLLVFIMFVIACGLAAAQQLMVTEPLAESRELTQQQTKWENDYSFNACALLVLKLDIDDAEFEGDIKKSERKKDCWHIWMVEGSNYLKIRSKKYTPFSLDFDQPLHGKHVYTLTIAPQQLLVTVPFAMDERSTDAVREARKDNASGKNCALVLMGLAVDSAVFEGQIVDQSFRSGEWWIWIAPNSRTLTVNVGGGLKPLTLNFDPLESSRTYNVTIQVPKIDTSTHAGSLPYEGSWLVLANYAFSFNPQHSLGFTVGRVGKFGWYVNAMLGGSPGLTYDETLADGASTLDYLWNGSKKNARLSVTAGGIFALWPSGYVYAGVGYGMRNSVWYTRNGSAVLLDSHSYNGLAFEAGMMFRLSDHMMLSAGMSELEFFKYVELKIGAGYKF